MASCARCGDPIDDGKSLCFTCASIVGAHGLAEPAREPPRGASARSAFWPSHLGPRLAREGAEPGTRVTMDAREVVVAVTNEERRTLDTVYARKRVRDVRLTAVETDLGLVRGRVTETVFNVALLVDTQDVPVLTTTHEATALEAVRWLREALAATAGAAGYRG